MPKTARASDGAAGADQSGQSEDLAMPHAKDRLCRSGKAVVTRPTMSQTARLRRSFRRRMQRFQVAADHQPDHGGMGELVARQLAHRAPVAQHHDAVGAGHDLAEPVRDVDHCDAVRLQIGDHLQQPLGLRQRQARGRLVHDDDARVERERLGDLDHLPLRDRQIVDQRVGPKSTPSRCSSGVTRACIAACSPASAGRRRASRGR